MKIAPRSRPSGASSPEQGWRPSPDFAYSRKDDPPPRRAPAPDPLWQEATE